MSTERLPSAEALFDGAACGLLLTRADGTILRANQTFCDWTGHQPAALAGQRKLQELLTMGGRIFHQTHWAPLLQLQGSVSELKLELLHRDGRPIPMMMNALRRERGGTVWHEIAVFVAEDRHKYERELLDARKRAELLLQQQQQARHALTRAETRLRLAISAAQLFIWDVDATTGQRTYEPAVAGLLGSDGPGPVSEADFAAAIHPDDAARESQVFAAAMVSGGAESLGGGAYHCSYRLNGRDGQQRTVSSAGRAFFNTEGRLLQFVGVLQDITDASRQRAAAEDRALFAEQMVGIVSHDLRNPLAAIQMGAQLMARGELNASQLRLASNIGDAAARAQRLIVDLLDFTLARVGRGLSLAKRPLALHGLVAGCVDELALAFPTRALVHAAVGEGDCSVDADRLAQLIGNLVANAVAYGAADRPVSVTSVIEAAHFSVSVHNEGTPLRAELLPRLFEPMTRGNVSSSARSIGLGLFIVREIARAHQGEVSVVSSAEAGTTFAARLPR